MYSSKKCPNKIDGVADGGDQTNARRRRITSGEVMLWEEAGCLRKRKMKDLCSPGGGWELRFWGELCKS